MLSQYDDDEVDYDEDPNSPLSLSPLDEPDGAYPSSSTITRHPPPPPSTSRPAVLFNQPTITINSHTHHLIPTSELHPSHRNLFPFTFFNPVQSLCFQHAYREDCPMVVSAPTGSGKTGVLELAVLRLFLQVEGSRPKVIYIAPMRALCQERLVQWRGLFAPLGLRCMVYTGDTTDPPREAFVNSDVIVTTPEKFDGLSRRRDTMGAVLAMVGLVCIDEVHILHEARGACLEGIVARMKLMQSKYRNELTAASSATSLPITRLRFIALSATIKNYQDLAQWLGNECVAFPFGDEYRPCPLQYYVHSYPSNTNAFHFERSLDSRVVDVLSRYSLAPDQRTHLPSLVFCNTRKATSHTAKKIIEECAFRGLRSLLIQSEQHSARLKGVASQVHDRELSEAVRGGAGFHHAGLDADDRRVIEQAFLSSTLLVVCATGTLSLGVNLPAHLVVVKSTKFYQPGKGWTEYDTSSLLQMTGRAGRPQFDKEGVAVVMCDDSQRERYEQLMGGLMPVESTFLDKLIEHLNSEVIAASVTNTEDAIVWLQHTFLFVRCIHNPRRYGIQSPLTASQRQKVVEGWVSDSVGKLVNEQCIRVEGGRFVGAEKGKAMYTNYLSFPTICLFSQITPRITFPELLHLFCQAHEFADLRPRQGEKTPLNTFLRLDKDQRAQLDPPPIIPYPLPSSNKSIKDTADKLYVLIQGVCVGRQLPSGAFAFNLKQDVEQVMGQGVRVARAMEQYVTEVKLSVFAIKGCIQLRKSLGRRCLSEGDRRMGRVLTQLYGIGTVHAQQLASGGLDTFDRVRAANAERLEGLKGKGLVAKVQAGMRSVPLYELGVQWQGNMLEVQVRQKNRHFVPDKASEKRGGHFTHLIVGLQHSGEVIAHHRFRLQAGDASEMTFPIKAKLGDRLRFDVVDGSLIGVDVFYKYDYEPRTSDPSDIIYMGVEAPRSGLSPPPAAILVEAIDDENQSSAPAAAKPGSTVCQHSQTICLQSMCQHDCCQKRALILGAKKGSHIDLHSMQQHSKASAKAVPLPVKKPFQPPAALSKGRSTQETEVKEPQSKSMEVMEDLNEKGRQIFGGPSRGQWYPQAKTEDKKAVEEDEDMPIMSFPPRYQPGPPVTLFEVPSQPPPPRLPRPPPSFRGIVRPAPPSFDPLPAGPMASPHDEAAIGTTDLTRRSVMSSHTPTPAPVVRVASSSAPRPKSTNVFSQFRMDAPKKSAAEARGDTSSSNTAIRGINPVKHDLHGARFSLHSNALHPPGDRDDSPINAGQRRVQVSPPSPRAAPSFAHRSSPARRSRSRSSRSMSPTPLRSSRPETRYQQDERKGWDSEQHGGGSAWRAPQSRDDREDEVDVDYGGHHMSSSWDGGGGSSRHDRMDREPPHHGRYADERDARDGSFRGQHPQPAFPHYLPYAQPMQQMGDGEDEDEDRIIPHQRRPRSPPPYHEGQSRQGQGRRYVEAEEEYEYHERRGGRRGEGGGYQRSPYSDSIDLHPPPRYDQSRSGWRR